MAMQRPYGSEIEAEARRLFNLESTTIAERDRGDYRSFEQMPLGLQQWWKHRAERRLLVNATASARMHAMRRP